MSVVVLVPLEWDAAQLVRWAAHFAIAQDTDLVALLMSRPAENNKVVDIYPSHEQQADLVAKLTAALNDRFIWSAPEDNANPAMAWASDFEETSGEIERAERTPPKHHFLARRLPHEDPIRAAVAALKQFDDELLIIPRHNQIHEKSAEFAMPRELLKQADCATLLLCPGQHDGREIKSLLVPTSAAPQSRPLLELASNLCHRSDREITAVYVQPDVDEVAQSVGERSLDQALERFWKKSADKVKKRVILNSSPVAGIRQAYNSDPYDLMLLGASYDSLLHRVWVNDVTEQLIRGQDSPPPIAVIRRPIPWSSRVRRGLEKTLRDGVPQLQRQDRVSLVERVQSNSAWDFDFIALMCLSTIIAACGLLLDSAAIVIGAMLVAPLMTPLLGSGLSLVQGNVVLLKNTIKSVAGGFCLAFLICVVMGLAHGVFGDNVPTREMQGRGSPSFLDLIVALVSGIAAAYATGRPNLISALPGVAIAAALVPPIATSGLAAAMGEFGLSTRAALLFLTNIVAITLGTACSLWAVGIRGYHDHGPWQDWSRWITTSLIVLASLLAIYFVMPHNAIPPKLHDEFTRVTSANEAELLVVDYASKTNRIRIIVRSSKLPSSELANQLAELAAQAYRTKPKIELETRLFVESSR